MAESTETCLFLRIQRHRMESIDLDTAQHLVGSHGIPERRRCGDH